MKRFIAFLFAATLGVGSGLLVAANYEVTQVTDDTMASTYREGDHILVDRMTIAEIFGDGRAFRRGDVILFENHMYMETGEGSVMMKRIVGMPGEWVSIEEGVVYIDGEPLDESDYLTATDAGTFVGEDMVKRFVDAGQYFVLGDHRAKSTDSRSETVGLVKAEDIKGKVITQW